ncbi:MAG: ABC-type transport auxiliary lipoprotein family protein [Hyphomicrobiales bacterium]
MKDLDSRTPILRAAAALLVAAGVGGCALAGGSGPAPATFDLTAPDSFADIKGTSSAQILVKEPSALKALDSERIVVKPTPAAVEYYAGAQWSDRLPRLVQTRLAEAFENSRRFRAVGRPGDGLLIDYQIVTDIRAFQIETSGADEAVVTISAKILNERNGRVVAARLFTARLPVTASSTGSAVAGLDAAMDAVLGELVGWTVARI